MRIILNGEAFEVNACLLDQILVELKHTGPMIATAVNSEFIHKQGRHEVQLKEGDRLEVVSPISGG